MQIRNYQKLIDENRALGECDHPDTAVVELKNTSHIVREAYMKDDIVYGTIEILPTPSGKIIQDLISSGVTLGISSRGVGSVQSVGGNTIVQEDFQLICFDIVSEPSTPNAYVYKDNKSDVSTRLREVKENSINNLFKKILGD